MGCLLIIGAIFLIAYSNGNEYIIALGVVVLVWGCCKAKTEGGTTTGGGSGHSGDNDGGYDGHVHTGTGTPNTVHRSNGVDVDTRGYGWQDSVYGGRENIFTGESLEKDVLGKWTYTDSDGDTDDYATFDD